MIHSPAYMQLCDRHRILAHRDILFWSLAQACAIPEQVRVVPPAPASVDALLEFHSRQYVSALQTVSHALDL